MTGTVTLPVEDVLELLEAAKEAKRGAWLEARGTFLPLDYRTEDRLDLALETIKQEMFNAGVRA